MLLGWHDWTRQAAGTPDNPYSGAQSWQPPYLRMLDTPGWSAYAGIGPNSRTLRANRVSSDINATEVWIQQVFKTWVEGEDCFNGNRSDVSTKVIWHNSLHLIRDTPSSPWRAGTNCRIHDGPMAFGSTALL